MSADFWAGYVSGAAGVIVGNPLDIIKVQLQNASHDTPAVVVAEQSPQRSYTSWIRGGAVPILTYGAMNAVLYAIYNRCLNALDPTTIGQTNFPQTSFWQLWTAGAVAGMSIWAMSTPTELIKCLAQLQVGKSSWLVTKELWETDGLRGLYRGGAVTSIRDAVGYGFYFWSYEAGKRSMGYVETEDNAAVKILVAGGIAGMLSWLSVYPLDVIKTRVQSPDHARLPGDGMSLSSSQRPSAWSIAKAAYRQDGIGVFFRGLGVCSVRAFMVDGVQWYVYEQVMKFARP